MEVVRLIAKILSNIKSNKGSNLQALCHEDRCFDSGVWRSYIWELIMDHANIFHGDADGKQLWLNYF